MRRWNAGVGRSSRLCLVLVACFVEVVGFVEVVFLVVVALRVVDVTLAFFAAATGMPAVRS